MEWVPKGSAFMCWDGKHFWKVQNTPWTNRPGQVRPAKVNLGGWLVKRLSSPLPELRLHSELLYFPSQMFYRPFQGTSSVTLPSSALSQQGLQERKSNDYSRPWALGKANRLHSCRLTELLGPSWGFAVFSFGAAVRLIFMPYLSAVKPDGVKADTGKPSTSSSHTSLVRESQGTCLLLCSYFQGLSRGQPARARAEWSTGISHAPSFCSHTISCLLCGKVCFYYVSVRHQPGK